MEQIWCNLIKEAMKEQKLSVKQLAEIMDLPTKEMEQLLDGTHRITFSQLAKIVKLLNIDINHVFGLENRNDMDLAVEDDWQACINHYTRRIPKENRSHFLQAVRYLAECFEPVEQAEKEEE